MISLIMPMYNRYDLAMRRMMEFHQYFHNGTDQEKKIKAPEDLEILMINNGSRPGTIIEENIYYWQKMAHWFPVRYLKREENIGFGGAMNWGAKKAEGNILLFYSDDVRLTGNFLPKLRQIFEEDPTCLVGGEVIWWPGGWNEFEIEGKKIVVPYANGWLLACKKEVWEKSGGFDPIYYPYDFEDVDLSTRWHEMGYNIKALNSNFVAHIGGATISGLDSDRASKTQKHRAKYIMKWYDKLPLLNTSTEKNNEPNNPNSAITGARQN